jgi:hypothetical protein
MSDSGPIPYGRNGTAGRDALGRFAPGNRAAAGRSHPFARQAAALRRAFFTAVTEEDMRTVVRTLVSQAQEGNLQACRLLMLWILGKPHDAIHPDAIQAAVEAAEAQASEPLPLPADCEARLDLVARQLAQDMRRKRRGGPDPGALVETTEDLDTPF